MSGPAPSYAICELTGLKVPKAEIVERWDGVMVWAPYLDERHPMLDLPPPRGESVNPPTTVRENDVEHDADAWPVTADGYGSQVGEG